MSNFLTRRDLGRLASFFLLGGLVPARRAAAEQPLAAGVGAALETAPNVYKALGVRPLDALRYRFTGTLAGGTLSGTLDMGEYLGATWVGRRYVAGRRA